MYKLTQNDKTETCVTLPQAIYKTYTNAPATVALPDGSILEYDGMSNWTLKRDEIALDWKYSSVGIGKECCTAKAFGHTFDVICNCLMINDLVFAGIKTSHTGAKQTANDWINSAIKNAGKY